MIDLCTLPKFPIKLQANDYTIGPADNVRRSDSSIAGRYRRDAIGATQRVTVSRVCSEEEYRAHEGFYHSSLEDGSLPFRVTLWMNNPEPEEVKAFYVPLTKRMDNIQETQFTISAEFEVFPNKRDKCFDISLATLMGENEGDVAAVCETLDLLEQLVEVEWPEDLPSCP